VNGDVLIIVIRLSLKAFFFLLLATVADAEALPINTVRVIGNAEIVLADIDTSRKNAIADALKQAEMSLGVYVVSSEHTGQFGEDSSSQIVRANHSLISYQVVKEWESANSYHVELIVRGMENSLASTGVKKKILFLQFEASNSLQVEDIRNPYSELPKLLAYRFETRGGVISSFINGILPNENEELRRNAVVKLAKDTGAQFIVAGVIEEAGINKEGVWGSYVRSFRVRITLYDGITGATLRSFVLAESAKGRVEIGADKSFGGRAFLATESGKSINRLGNLIVSQIASTIECLPFSARIVRVDKDLIYLDAGATSRLAVGDKLTVFSLASHFPTATAAATEEPIASINLYIIHPLISTANVDQKYKEVEIKAGNIARIELSQGGACLK